MAVVALNFRPPTEPDIVKLYIYEAPAKDGPYSLIETVTAVGTSPNYITRYTTTLATNVADWFAIEWENAKGAKSGISSGMQGGTETLVSELTERVLLRDPSLNENVVAQEAEAVVEEIFPARVVAEVMKNEANYRQISGMVLLTWARAALLDSIVSNVSDWTAGIVSMKSASGTKRDISTIEKVIVEANKYLGRNYSTVLLLKEMQVAGGFKRLVGADISRNIYELQ